MTRPLAIDLCCGLAGWSEGLVAEGWRVQGYDVEDMFSALGEPRPEHFELVLQDIRKLHGSQFADADLIVASPPCQEYSYFAMPWTRAKQIARALRGNGEFPEGYTGSRTLAELTALFDACFRIQREACAAAGRHIPMVVENVRGAEPWVGRAAWNFGSYYLWGDVPALMPATMRARKNPGFRFDGSGRIFQSESVARHVDAQKTRGQQHRRDGHPHTRHLTHPTEGRKGDWFGSGENCSLQRRAGSNTPARKAASAKIAKIPFALSSWIARTYLPETRAAA